MPERVVAGFLREFASNMSRVTREDIHIDAIAERYRDRRTWVPGALDCFAQAAALRNRNAWPVIVAIEFFLRREREPSGPPDGSLNALEPLLGYTPPALTLYRAGTEPWTVSSQFKQLVLASTGDVQYDHLFYQEWFDEEDAEYDRRVWLVSDPHER